MTHDEAHPQAGSTVTVVFGGFGHPQIGKGPHEFRLEDWWDRLTGGSWMDANGNPAALIYALRSAAADLPLDDEVVYGHVGRFGHLVHVSELEES